MSWGEANSLLALQAAAVSARRAGECLPRVARPPSETACRAPLESVEGLRHRAARPRLGGPPGTLVPPAFVRCVSPGMLDVYRLIEAIRHADLPVLFCGETGVGKEHLVRLLHDRSPRATGPFVAVNCAAIPGELVEAEMFGVQRGAATGVVERPGAFQTAAGGTLFLDEIGELPLASQAKLLRALESGQVQPIGGRGTDVDVRVVAATNSDLLARSRDGSFRADLFYRLAGCRIDVPPLRARRADLPALLDHFLGLACLVAKRAVPSIERAAMQRLLAHDWPGNVRELEHEVRRLTYVCPEGGTIGAEMLDVSIRSGEIRAAAAHEVDESLELRPRLNALSRELVCRALEVTAGNRVAAARLLGVSRNGLAAMVRRLDLRPRFGT